MKITKSNNKCGKREKKRNKRRQVIGLKMSMTLLKTNRKKVMVEAEVEIEELSNMMTMHDFLVVVIDLAVVEESFLQ